MAMSILHAISSRFLTGPGISVVALARAQRAAGLEVAFTCDLGEGLESAARAAGLEVLDMGLDRKGGPRSVSTAARRLRACDVDVLHVHRSSEHAAAALARRGGRAQWRIVRTLYRTEEPSRLRGWLRARLLARGTDAVIVQSAAGTEALAARLGSGRVHHVPGGVDVERLRPARTDRDADERFPAEAVLFGLVGKLNVKARLIDHALSAWARLAHSTPSTGSGPSAGSLLRQGYGGQAGQAAGGASFRALVLGDEGHPEPIEEAAARAGLSDVAFVVHSRRVPAERFEALRAMIDVAVQLAPGSDDACRATLEAMALGQPSVVYGTGALGELVAHGRTGLVVPPGDRSALAAAMQKLLEDADARTDMGRAARARAEAEFSLAAQVQRVGEVYGQVVQV